MDNDFGARLTKIMKDKNITNTELTEKARLSKNNIGNYKNGQIPNATILYNLSQILGVSMEYLIAGKEKENLTPEEQKLVDYYRKADDRGKRNILRTAEQESQELEYTTSKIG
jgi:transcriptional regulator with XRE-family HTH domain